MKEHIFETWAEAIDNLLDWWRRELFEELRETANVEDFVPNWADVCESFDVALNWEDVAEDWPANGDLLAAEAKEQLRVMVTGFLATVAARPDGEEYAEYIAQFWGEK